MDDVARVLKVDLHNQESYLLGASQTIKWYTMYGEGEYRIELVAFAENAKPATLVIAVDKKHNRLISNPRVSEVPPIDKWLPNGYLGYLKAQDNNAGANGDNL